MEGITIKIQRGVNIFAGMVAVAEAVARGEKKHENDAVVVHRFGNTYRVFMKK